MAPISEDESAGLRGPGARGHDAIGDGRRKVRKAWRCGAEPSRRGKGRGMREHYEIVFVGSGFSSQLFLRSLLKAKSPRKVLILEKGANRSWEWQIRNQRNEEKAYASAGAVELSGLKGKSWPHTVGVGGSSNCWWANTMRFHPADLKLKTTYGVGVD